MCVVCAPPYHQLASASGGANALGQLYFRACAYQKHLRHCCLSIYRACYRHVLVLLGSGWKAKPIFTLPAMGLI